MDETGVVGDGKGSEDVEEADDGVGGGVRYGGGVERRRLRV